MRYFLKKLVVGIVFLFAIECCFATPFSQPFNKSTRVLIISSYSPNFETYPYIMDGLKSVLKNHTLEYDVEFMDTKNFPESENIENFYQLLKYKLAHTQKYDVIIALDDNALDFVYRNHGDIFKDTPVVFLGVNNVEKATLFSKHPFFTGVFEQVSIDENFDMIRSILPHTKKIVSIFDNTYTSQTIKNDYHKKISNRNDFIFDEIDVSKLSFRQAMDKVHQLDKSDVIILVSFVRDKYNKRLSFSQGLDMLLSQTNRPIFHLYQHGIADGLIGGYAVSHYQQGQYAGEIVKKIIAGESIANLPPITSFNKPIIDYKVLKKHVNPEDVDLNYVEVINRKASFLEANFTLVINVVALVIFQTILIITLYYFMKKSKRAEKSLVNQKGMLESSNTELLKTNKRLKEAFTEISEKKTRIKVLVNTDTLTGLKSRYNIQNLLNTKLKYKGYKKLAVIFLDVDNFKDINDTFGHDFGDQILKIIGSRFKKIDSEQTIIGRFGGDEFIVVFEELDNHVTILDKVSEVLNIFRESFQVEGRHFYITASLGIAVYPKHAKSAIELIKKSDMALFEAKKRGKNKYFFYDSDLERELEDKVLFQTLVKNGFKSREFELYYQPYYDSNNQQINGYEALIRWHSDTLGQVSPYRLITTIESMGFIVEVGQWIVEEACRFLSKVVQKSDRALTLSINISALQIIHNDFYSQVTDIVEKMHLDPSLISFELTETVFLESKALWSPKINQLIEYGFNLSIDDFGTGYSSLSYFKNMPANIIKIDKSFINHITKDEYNQYFAETIINLAHACGKKVIAEGVETKEQFDMLRDYKCDIIQGYYFSKPLPENHALEIL